MYVYERNFRLSKFVQCLPLAQFYFLFTCSLIECITIYSFQLKIFIWISFYFQTKAFDLFCPSIMHWQLFLAFLVNKLLKKKRRFTDLPKQIETCKKNIFVIKTVEKMKSILMSAP